MADEVATGTSEGAGDVAVEAAEPTSVDQIFDEAFAEPDEATSPDTSEPVAETDEDPSPDAPPSETEDSSPPRDASGRFASKEEPASEDPPADEAAAPDDEVPETDEVVAETDTETPEDEVSEEAAVFEEFSYKVNGREFSVPGSKVGSDGMFIPQAEVERLQRLVSLGHNARQRDREVGQQIAEARSEGNARADHIESVFNNLLEMRKADPDGLYTLFRDQGKWDLMVANQRIRALETGTAERDSVQAERNQVAEGERLFPVLQSRITEYVSTAAKGDKFAGVDQEAVAERLTTRHWGQVFHALRAGQAAPEGMVIVEQYENGASIAMDTSFIEGEMEYEAGVVRRTETRTRSEQKVAKKNRANLKPAAVHTKKAAPPPRPKKPKVALEGREAVEEVFDTMFDE